MSDYLRQTAYRGWTISYDANRPRTGWWRAERFGVGMCAGDRDSLFRMIDQRRYEEQVEADKRKS